MKVMTAARRSLQLLNLALLTSSPAYSAEVIATASFVRERRSTDRRQVQADIRFPNRRIVDRRAVGDSMQVPHGVPTAANTAPLETAAPEIPLYA